MGNSRPCNEVRALTGRDVEVVNMGSRGINSVSKVLGMFAVAGSVLTVAPSVSRAGSDPYAHLPGELSLTGVIRDFREKSVSGGHPDFERQPTAGFGHYMNLVQDELDSDSKPVFKSTGYKVGTQWKDAAGRNIISPRSYISAKSGDQAGNKSSTAGGAVTSGDSLQSWFRDSTGVNLSKQLTVKLKRQTGTNIYTFDDKLDSAYSSKGGLFPINAELFGNSAGGDKNFHFTYELQTEFVYEQGKGQVFTFTGDDDVWVFIDGKLVIDIGGVHSAVSQTIELDRLNWLTDKQEYKLSFFFAERHRTQSNCRIDTTLVLKSVTMPMTTGIFD